MTLRPRIRFPQIYLRTAAPALYFFFVMLGIILGRGARDSLFLSHPYLGIPALPWIYIGNAVFGALAAAVYAAIVMRLSPRRFALVSVAIFSGIIVAAWLLASFGEPTVIGAVAIVGAYLLSQAVWVLGLMQVWTIAGGLFDAREAKEAFPLVGAGSLAGMIVAGFVAKPLAAALGTTGTFWAWFGLELAAAAVLAALIAPRLGGARPVSHMTEGETQGWKQNFHLAWNEPLPRFLIFLTLLLWIVFTVLDYQFNLVAREAFTEANAAGEAVVNKDALTGFLGGFRGICGFGALLFQFFVTPVLVRRLGVGRGVLVHPAANAVTTGAMALSFGFWTTTVAKGADHVLLYTIQDSSYSLLFNAVPPERRGRVRSFVEGTIRPVATGFGGLLLLGAGFAGRAGISAMLFCLSIAWFIIALRIRAGYVQGLVTSLATTRRHEEEEAAELRSPTSVQALRDSLSAVDSLQVATALDAVALLGLSELRPEIHRLLAASHPHVRSAAVSALGVLADEEDYHRALELTTDADPEVRARAVEACGALGADRGVEELIPLVKDENESVRVAALVALIRFGGLDGILVAAETLGRMLESASHADRALAVKILGEVRVRHFIPSLLKLLKDPHPLVRHRVVRALGKIGSERATQPLVECLADPHLCRTALYGLVRIGKKAIPSLGTALERGAPEVRRLAAEGLARIGRHSVVGELLPYATDEDPAVRSVVLEGLAAHGTHVRVSEERTAALRGLVTRELREAYAARMGIGLLKERFGDRGGAATGFLMEVTGETMATAARRALLAFGIMSRPDAILDLERRLASSDSRTRSLASEAVENLGSPELSRPLLAVMDREGTEWREAHAEMIAPEDRALGGFLARLAGHPSALVRAALGSAVCGEADEVFKEIRGRLAADADPLVAESTRMDGGDEMFTTIEKVLFLRSAPIFGTISREDLTHIAAIAETVQATAGQAVFEFGEAGDSLYLVVKGRVQVLDRKGGVIAELAAPEVFGEMAILDDCPRSATVRAVEACEFLRISREEFRELIMERPEIAFSIFRLLTGRLRAAIGSAVPTGVMAV